MTILGRKSFDTIDHLEIDHDPTSVATEAIIGSLAFQSGTPNIYQKTSAPDLGWELIPRQSQIAASFAALNHASRHLPAGADPLATAAAVGLDTTSTNTLGTAESFSKSDHTHAISSAAAAAQTPDQTNAAGSSASFAKADHVHNIATAAPTTALSATTTNGQGAASTFTRSDHSHEILTATAIALNAASTTGVGTSASLARADHSHSIEAALSAAITAMTPAQVAAAGTATSFARGDHVHAIAVGVPVTVGTSNAEGTGSTFARNDHVHDHGSQSVATHHAVATIVNNGFMSATDKSKLDSIPSPITGTTSTTNATVTNVLTYATVTDKVYTAEVKLTGRRTGGSAGAAGDSAHFVRRFIARNTGGTLTLLAADITTEYNRKSQTGFNITIDALATDIRIRAQGTVNNNMDWKAELIITEL